MNIKAFRTALFISIILLNLLSILSQEPSWKLLPGSPVAGRFDDLFFINDLTGWAAGSSPTKIYKTTNGGLIWHFLTGFSGYSRSFCFLDSITGFMGTLNGSQHLFKTTNGGFDWNVVVLDSNNPEGICGLSYSGNTIMGSGMYSGFPRVVLSTNRGDNWKIINLAVYADALIDCYLVSETEAFVVGGKGSSYSTRRGVILHTQDAGNTWETRFTSLHSGNWGWKISFPASNVGYVSLENEFQNDTSFFAKTTNGGINWIEKPFGVGVNYREQGIGFVNETTGWMGGYTKFYATTDGGNNWVQMNIDPEFSSINRIRFYGDTLGYAGGKRIYKYTSDKTIGIWANQNNIPGKISLFQNYPNPFNPVTIIKYEIFEKSMSTIKIFNATGEEVYSFSNGFRTPGIREFIWYGTDYNGNLMPSGVYFYKLETEKYSETKKMILVR
jgi:photosystem II stability/assembly factor-like uncharacterized protein